ncbi:hypothetical protein AB9F39_37930, partial [Rhizobium leguminosarum]
IAAISIEAEAGRERYRALSRRKLLILVAITAALCLSFAVDLAWGPARYSLTETPRACETKWMKSVAISAMMKALTGTSRPA